MVALNFTNHLPSEKTLQARKVAEDLLLNARDLKRYPPGTKFDSPLIMQRLIGIVAPFTALFDENIRSIDPHLKQFIRIFENYILERTTNKMVANTGSQTKSKSGIAINLDKTIDDIVARADMEPDQIERFKLSMKLSRGRGTDFSHSQEMVTGAIRWKQFDKEFSDALEKIDPQFKDRPFIALLIMAKFYADDTRNLKEVRERVVHIFNIYFPRPKQPQHTDDLNPHLPDGYGCVWPQYDLKPTNFHLC